MLLGPDPFLLRPHLRLVIAAAATREQEESGGEWEQDRANHRHFGSIEERLVESNAPEARLGPLHSEIVVVD